MKSSPEREKFRRLKTHYHNSYIGLGDDLLEEDLFLGWHPAIYRYGLIRKIFFLLNLFNLAYYASYVWISTLVRGECIVWRQDTVPGNYQGMDSEDCNADINDNGTRRCEDRPVYLTVSDRPPVYQWRTESPAGSNSVNRIRHT